ncbi:Maf family protein [Paenibacillus aurantius]|uniref:dTTP/UTP pyrophosphatase n=1 Tax=Paenibacillus aurantius TaxID=2918900 RepID=A0AA96LF89_9BACL|nr:Maf family protein [Paenibacillus aurantius]WNQ12969.1 Maf family protein [Paenibacillus aurantius]
MSPNAHPLILASSSPRRQELIRTLGLPYVIRVSDADETVEPGLSPAQIVETLALRKAETVHELIRKERDLQGGVIIGSDTVVVLDGEVLGKPRDREDAFMTLTRLQGSTHEVFSGVACLAAGEPEQAQESAAAARSVGPSMSYRLRHGAETEKPSAAVGHSVSKVTFRPMSPDEIRAYIATGEPMDKAGSYGVQGLGSLFVERIDGDFYSVMGLPMNLLYSMLLEFGISPFRQPEGRV